MAKGSLGLALNQALETEKKKKPVRTEPNNLEEHLSLEEARSNKGREIMQDKIKNFNYAKDEWKKMQYNHESLEGANTEIHYWENEPIRINF